VPKEKPTIVKEHGEPRKATVKQLYGTAFRCAKPGCREPLYRVNSATGKTVLNSRVSHIHARREGAARWNAEMSEEENRGAENLVLLCIPDSYEIDELPDDYPAEMLREWKKAQLALAERLQQSWEITDEQVAEVAQVSFTLEKLVDVIAAKLPFSPRQRERAVALDLADRRIHVGRVDRLRSVTPDRVEQVLRWMGELPDPIVDVPPGRVLILVAPMGAGKTEQAARWLEEGIQHAWDDDAVAIPVWLEARDVKGSLEDAVRAQLGEDPTAVCRVVLNDLDRIDPTDAQHLLHAAHVMVGVWTNVAILATAQSSTVAVGTASLNVEPWTVERGVELMRVASDVELPWHLRSPETTELLCRPLTALALATRLASGGGADVSRLQLLQDLPKTILQQNRPSKSTPEVWQALGQLAIEILQAGGPVRAATAGNEAKSWQLTDTRLVVERDGMLSFALPLFEQHFGAQAITAGTFDIEAAVDRTSFPYWRYAITFAIATCPDAAERERMLLKVARTNPAALSWILDESGPMGKSVGEGIDLTVALSAGVRHDQLAGTKADAEGDKALALELREAFEALLEGYGPLAGSLARHHGGSLTQWGVFLASGYLTLAEHWDETEPSIVLVSDFSQLNIRQPGGWVTWQMSKQPSGIDSRWVWARGKIMDRLTAVIEHRALTTSVDTRLTSERLWALASFAISDAGVALGLDTIPLDALRQKVAQMMETVNRTASSTWRHGGDNFGSPDIAWLNDQLAFLRGEQLQRPWPLPDQPLLGGRKRWQGYRPDLAVSMTAEILAEAVVGYRDLVETNFPCFGPALGLYSILPARIEGTIIHHSIASDLPPQLSFAWVPDSDLDPRAPAPVELRTENAPLSQPYWHRPKGPRLESRFAYHLPMIEDGISPLGSPRPSSNLAYEWLARDLHALGWLKNATTFRG
jgi:hypothetical protein